jgi:hypothetical protein
VDILGIAVGRGLGLKPKTEREALIVARVGLVDLIIINAS